MQVQENVQEPIMTYVCKCKRTYSSVAWHMCASARQHTAAWHDVCVQVQDNIQQCGMTYVCKCKTTYSKNRYKPTPPPPTPHPPTHVTTVTSLSETRHLKLEPHVWRSINVYHGWFFFSGWKLPLKISPIFRQTLRSACDTFPVRERLQAAILPKHHGVLVHGLGPDQKLWTSSGWRYESKWGICSIPKYQ